MTIGIIAGSSLLGSELFSGLKADAVQTKYGSADLWQGEGFLFIQRHGKKCDILPHLINHQANMLALKARGVTDIVGICSCGSYRENLPPGSIIIPHDFMSFYPTPTFFDRPMTGLMEAFTLPGIDEGLRESLIKATKMAGVKVQKKGVYLQVPGPRLETMAEVRMFMGFADIVGMTMASEATLAKEAGLRYAAICQVDNFGRGIADSDIDFSRMEKTKAKALQKVKAIIGEFLGDAP